jgi:two-component system, OmpR family, response regulator
MRILIIEDEHKIAQALKKGLELETYSVDTAYDGETGRDLALTEAYDLMIFDLMLPKVSGTQIAEDVRKNKIQTPILMLTAKSQLTDKLDGFAKGADDYLTKPFAFEELLARIQALLRRPPNLMADKITYDDISLDTATFEVTRQGKNLSLSRKEFSLLQFLMRNPDRILTKEQIIQHVWDYDSDVLENTVEQYMGYLRNKLEKPFAQSPKVINTVRGFGYVFGKK